MIIGIVKFRFDTIKVVAKRRNRKHVSDTFENDFTTGPLHFVKSGQSSIYQEQKRFISYISDTETHLFRTAFEN